MGYSKKRRYKKKQYGGEVVFKYPEEDFKYAQIYGLIEDPEIRSNVIKIMNEDNHFLFTKDDLLPPQDPGTLELRFYSDFKESIKNYPKKKDSFEQYIANLNNKLVYENEKNVFLRKFVKALYDASNKELFDQITQEKLFLKKLFPNSGTYINRIYNVSSTSASAVRTDPTIILSANLVSEITFINGVIMNAIELENLSILSHLKTIKILDAIGANKYSFIKSDSVENVTIENDTFSDINQLFFERCPRLKNITIKSTALVSDVNSILEKLPDGVEYKTVDLTDTNVTIVDQAKYNSLLNKKNTKITMPTAKAALSTMPVDQTEILKRNRIINGIRTALKISEIETNHKKQLEKIENESKIVKAEMDNIKKEKTKLETENKNELEKVKKKLEDEEKKFKTLESEKQAVEAQRAALETEKTKLEGDAQAQAVAQATALKKANDDAAEAAQQAAAAEAKTRQELEDLKKKNADDLKANQAEKDKNDDKIRQLQSELQRLGDELTGLKRSGAAQNKIKETEGIITIFTNLIQNLNAENARRDAQTNELIEKQYRAENQLKEELRQQIFEANQREQEKNRQLENIIAEQKEAEKQRQEELREIGLKQNELDKEKNRLYSELQIVSNEKNSFAEIINNKQNEINNINKNLDNVKAENKRLSDEKKAVVIEADKRIQAKLDEQKKINEQLIKENEQKQKEYQAQLEAERVSKSQIANDLAQQFHTRLEENRIKQAQIQAEQIKQAQIQAEQKFQDQIKQQQERIRQAESEANRIRQAESEAIKERQSQIQAEIRKQEKLNEELKQLKGKIKALKNKSKTNNNNEKYKTDLDNATTKLENIKGELKSKEENIKNLEAENKRLAAVAKQYADAVKVEKQKLADIKAEAERLAAEADAKRLAEIEAEKQRLAERLAAEAEAKRQADEAEAKRQADEAEAKRQAAAAAAAEAEKKRLADAEAEKKRLADAEAEKKRLAEIEAERKRQEEIEAERKRQEENEAERKRQEEIEAERKRQEEIEAERKRQEEIEAERKRQEEIEAEKQRPAEIEAEAKPFTAPLFECSVGKISDTRSCDETSGEKSSTGSLLNNNGIAKLIVKSEKNGKSKSETYENIVFAKPDSNFSNQAQHLVVTYYDSNNLKKVFFKAPIPPGVKAESSSNRDKWIEQIQKAFNLKPLYYCSDKACKTTTLGRIQSKKLEIYYYDLYNEKKLTHTYENITKVETSSDGENKFVITYKKKNSDNRDPIDSTQKLQTNNTENLTWWIEEIKKIIPEAKRGGRGTKRMRSDHKRSDHKRSDHKQSDHKQSDHKQSDHNRSDHNRSDHNRSNHNRSNNKHNDTKQNRGKKFRVTRKKLRKAERP